MHFMAAAAQVFAKERIVPLIALGIRADGGIYRMAIDPRLRGFIKDDDQFVDAMTRCFRKGLLDLLYKPMDDMELKWGTVDPDGL